MSHRPMVRSSQESWLLDAAWVWLVEAPGVKRPTTGAAAANCRTARCRGFLEDATVTELGFQWQQWHELPTEVSPMFSSDS